MTTLHSSRFALGFAAILAFGCSSSDPDNSDGTDVPHVELQEVLRLGDEEGNSPNTFGRIGGVLLDADGRIFVADAMNHEIRVFSESGEFLYGFVREGEGPGEVRGPCCLAIAPDGALWVRDVGNGRFVVYRVGESSADYEHTVLLPTDMAASRNLWESIVFDDSSRFVVAGRIMLEGEGIKHGHGVIADIAEGGPPTLLTRTLIPEPSEDSIPVHIIRSRQGSMLTMQYFYQPYGAQFITAYGPGGNWARAVTSVPRVERYSVDGTLLHAIDVQASPVPLSARERHISDSVLAMGRSGGAEIPFSTPATKHPLVSLKFDTGGRLWVERNTVDGEPREADVFDREGQHVMRVRWPRDVRIGMEAWVGTELVAGIGRGEYDEPHVVVMRMVPLQ